MEILDLVVIALILAVCALSICMMRPSKKKERNNLNTITPDRRKKIKQLLVDLNLTIDSACQEFGIRRPVTMGKADLMISLLEERKKRARR